MKQVIPVSFLRERFTVGDDGVVRWASRPSSHFVHAGNHRNSLALVGQPVRGHSDVSGYLRLSLTIEGKQKTILAHRVVFALVHGYFADQVDHVNGDKTDNRPMNLRDGGDGVNRQNLKRACKNNKSGFLGVSYKPKKSKTSPYYAKIHRNGVEVHLGVFATAEEAHAAYVQAKRVIHVGCTL